MNRRPESFKDPTPNLEQRYDELQHLRRLVEQAEEAEPNFGASATSRAYKANP